MASGSQAMNKGSDEMYNQDCDVCLSNGKTSEAISYCNICCEHLCQSCDMAHKGSKATKDHTILTGSKIPPGSTTVKPTLPFMFCDTHKTTLLDIYCTTHDEVICPACKMTSHTRCDTGDVSRHSAKVNVGQELKKVANCLNDLTIRYDDLTKNRHTDNSTVKSQIQNCLGAMQHFRKDMNDKLDTLEKIMSSEIRQIEETMEKEIDGHVTLADDIVLQIGDLNKSLSECKETGEDDVIFVGSKKASSRASEYNLIIGNIQKDIYPIDIRFQPNCVLSDMIQHSQSLGTVANNRLIQSGSKQTSILNMSVKTKRVNNVTLGTVSGCTFMSDGHLIKNIPGDGGETKDKDG